MNYNGLPCPVCQKPMAEDEDVVVCPVCATPQHRECWVQNGRCVNDELHGSGFVWQSEASSESRNKTENNVRICHICGSENPSDSLHCGNCGALFEAKAPEADSGMKICAFCGKENDSDARHCKNCGAPLIKRDFVYSENPYLIRSGFSENELIGGQKAGDLSFYVQASPKRYLTKFKKFANGKKLSFNFAAFFFAPYWFFYRKLYKAGAFALVVFATAAMILSGFSAQINTAANDYLNFIDSLEITENSTEEEFAAAEDAILQEAEKITQAVKKPMLIICAVEIILRLIFALIADRLYYRHCMNNLRLINQTVEDKNLKYMMIRSKGGLSLLAFTASILGNNVLLMALDSIAAMINNL